MRIGIDFDNTIACYDGVFYAAARDRELIPPEIGHDKNSVRDCLNENGQNNAFTELQGYVYGSRMDLAAPFDGVKDFIRTALAAGHNLFVISHKTQFPLMGPQYDLHEAARGFLVAQEISGEAEAMIAPDRVFFKETKEEKIAQAAALKVDVFIDDLPVILSMEGLEDARKILFDSNDQHGAEQRFERVQSWTEISTMLLGAKAKESPAT